MIRAIGGDEDRAQLPQGTLFEQREVMPMQRERSWWTWSLGHVAGIAIRVHVTLLLLLAWILFASRSFASVAIVAAVFVTIVVHELGHALMARRFGVRTRDIMLLPIGGIASLERMPDRPSQELAVALVGPAINLVIAALLWPVPSAFAHELGLINIGLALFNLIPAFPMDGGRALRALLAMRLGAERATDVAAACGKVFAIAIGVFGLFYNPLMILIAVVVWFGAQQERALVHLKAALHDVPVSAAMLRRVDTVRADQPLEDAAELLLRGGQSQLPVVDGGKPIGVLTRSDVAAALSHSTPNTPVASAPQHEVLTVQPADSLDAVLDRLRQAPDAVAVVVDHGEPVGLLTAESLAAYVEMHQRAA